MSLYQSYRPKNFTDVVGQDFVKKVLMNSAKTQTFHHGYIFFGFHGIGKTTLARIFAEAVNCTNITTEGNPCHACPNCLAFDAVPSKMIDVIEIDAASYTGVDNIREVIEHSKFTPTQGKYKVYIIDEVHMLSKGAFNALLKTLEEPPAHVIFLLATTEIHKVPDTILSRVIRFDLTKIGEKDMLDHLMKICSEEGIQYEETALKMIVHRARGSLRDSLTMLEKCILGKSVETKNVEAALHLVNTGFLKETFEACESGEATKIQHIIHTINLEGIDVRQFAAQMTEWIVDNIETALDQKKFASYKELFDLFTRVYIQSRQVSVPMDVLKMSLYEKVQSGKLETMQKPVMEERRESRPKEEIKKEMPKVAEIESPEHELPPATNTIESPAAELPAPTHELPSEEISAEKTGGFSAEGFLQALQKNGVKTTLLPLLRTATIIQSDDTITIATTTFGKKRCEEAETMALLELTCKSFGSGIITIQVLEEVTETSEKGETITAADIAKDIFG